MQGQEQMLQADQQKRVEDACNHELGLIGNNCEYLNQHFARVGADKETRQAVADISTATVQLERIIQELMTMLDYLRAEELPELYPMDLLDLLKQIEAQADMVRAQIGVEIEIEYNGWTSCCVLADHRDAELVCLQLLSNALRACKEGGHVYIALHRGATFWQLSMTDDGCGLPGGDEESALENHRSFQGGVKLGLLLCRESCRRMNWGLQLQPAATGGTQVIVKIPLYFAPDVEDGMVELHEESDVVQEQRKYHLRAMLVREMRTLPDRGEPEE